MSSHELLAAGDLRPIDPLRPIEDGVYRDGLVRVRAAARTGSRPMPGAVRTPHFEVRGADGLVEVVHAVAPHEVDDDLAGMLADELFGPGWLRGPEAFERIFTGIVLTSAPDPLRAWELFYRNTLRRVEEAITSSGRCSGPGGHGTVAGYAPVYAHATALLAPGGVLELGSCFGFLSVRLAAQRRPVIATDVSAGTVALLAAVAPRLGVDLCARVSDATDLPRHHAAVDNVVAVHLLEHLPAEDGARVVDHAVRLARRRVVVAVPLEDEPNEAWGHVRTVGLDDLRALGQASGLPFEVHEHHGGWLVLSADGAARIGPLR